MDLEKTEPPYQLKQKKEIKKSRADSQYLTRMDILFLTPMDQIILTLKTVTIIFTVMEKSQ